jgi:hypothetical protein
MLPVQFSERQYGAQLQPRSGCNWRCSPTRAHPRATRRRSGDAPASTVGSEWFASEDADGPFSFVGICTADLDAEYVRAGCKRRLRRAPSGDSSCAETAAHTHATALLAVA